MLVQILALKSMQQNKLQIILFSLAQNYYATLLVHLAVYAKMYTIRRFLALKAPAGMLYAVHSFISLHSFHDFLCRNNF